MSKVDPHHVLLHKDCSSAHTWSVGWACRYLREKRFMTRPYTILRYVVVLGVACLVITPGMASSETVTIYRDDYGIPHIFGETEPGCAYGMGYAQAEDRLEEVLKNYKRSEGTMAETFGEAHFKADFRARLWRHYAKSKASYAEKSTVLRAIIEAFVAGFERYMKEHPQEVPDWAPEVTPYHIAAVGRLLIWGWPEGEAAGDLRRAGIAYEPDGAYRGSNQWLVAPERTAQGVPIALIDPHLSWYGLFRFYEVRYYGGDLSYSGMAVPGLPLGTLGHSRYCSVAMTTGGPDTADVFYYPVNPDNPRQYRRDGRWHDLEVHEETIQVKTADGLDARRFEMEYTPLGPVVARRDGRIYVMALAYWDETFHIDQVYAMNKAKNVAEMKVAFRMLQYMAQNIMVGTVDGDILYLRNGRVPIRPGRVDPRKPIDGEDPANDWQGLHALEDLVQVLNPPQGYMQNCNVSPYAMMKNSPMLPEDFPAYIYNADKTPPHQRAAMTLEQLDANAHVTIENGMAMALSTQVFGAGRWKARLATAMEDVPDHNEDADVLSGYIHAWDEHSRPDSVGAMAYKVWKDAIWADLLTEDERRQERYGAPPPGRLANSDLVRALEKAAETLETVYGSLTTPYGAAYRVGRRSNDGTLTKTWPVGGGNPGGGMAMPRNIGFFESEAGVHVGQSGQTSTQLVLLTKPPQSWTVLPLGESDHPDSPHYTDQAEKLFSAGLMKPTYFLNKAELMKHVSGTTVLQF